MKTFKSGRLLAVLSIFTVAVSGLAACEKNEEAMSPAESVSASLRDPPLVVDSPPFEGNFNPFFSAAEADRRVVELTGVYLFSQESSEGTRQPDVEDESGSGSALDPMTGIASVSVDRRETHTTYTFHLQKGVRFSDGVPLTADDAIFSCYVFCDPAYDGPNDLASLPIVGLSEYQTQISPEAREEYSTLFDEIYAAGEGGTAEGMNPETVALMWQIVNQEWKADVQGIVDYAMANYADDRAQAELGKTPEKVWADVGLQVAFGMVLWGFGSMDLETGVLTGPLTGTTWDLGAGAAPTIEDFFREVRASYGQVDAYDGADESATGTVVKEKAREAFIQEACAAVRDGREVPNVSGIKRISDRAFSVTLEGYDADALRHMDIPVAPLHYYGDQSLYDYENNQFGFPFGDLSQIKSKTAVPLGAGPYVLDRYEDSTVYFTANPYYWLGEPEIRHLQLKGPDAFS